MRNKKQMQEQEQDNFSLGFAVGVLAGVAGFFLTKTEEGKDIKEKMFAEWDNIRTKLEADGVITGDEQNIALVISKARGKIFSLLGEDAPKKKKKRGGKRKTGGFGRAGRNFKFKKSKSKGGQSVSKTGDDAAKTVVKRKKMFKGI